jgi:SAM-dependent methyltransferase
MTFAASLRDRLMETSFVYRLWQAPFAEQKLAPVLRDTDLRRSGRVLDLACGPGTNAHHFAPGSYTGVDLNRGYIERARGRYAGRFIVADATAPDLLEGERFDLILVNSFLHHLPTDEVGKTLARVNELLSSEGQIHVLDLLLPPRRGLARLLARADRGKYARPVAEWRELLERFFEPIFLKPFPVTAAGIPLWNMFHFKGKRRTDECGVATSEVSFSPG